MSEKTTFHDAPVQVRSDGRWQLHPGWKKDCDRCAEILGGILAERKRASEVDPLSVACPTCGEQEDKCCVSADDPFEKERPHGQRYRAAIRVDPEVTR